MENQNILNVGYNKHQQQSCLDVNSVTYSLIYSLVCFHVQALASDSQCKRKWCPFPCRSHSRCRKGEAQCVSASWYQKGHTVHEVSHQNPLLKLSTGQPANMGVSGIMALKTTMCVCVCFNFQFTQEAVWPPCQSASGNAVVWTLSGCSTDTYFPSAHFRNMNSNMLCYLTNYYTTIIIIIIKKDQKEGKDWCNAVWIYARERNYRCNLHSTADAREIWV